MTAIWNATGVTPAATNRLPVDVSSSGGASRVTMQQLADLGVLVGESHNALGTISSGTNDIDLSLGGFVSATIGGALTFTFSNPPASPNGCEWVLVLTNGGSAVVTWPGSVTWVGGTAPTLQASGIDVLRFYTVDGGTSWIGELAFDESGFLSPSDIASGTITPRADDIDLSGGTDGDVLTVQADGSLALETPAGGGSPAGTGTELQRRNGANFEAVTGSSVSGADVTFGGVVKATQFGGSATGSKSVPVYAFGATNSGFYSDSAGVDITFGGTRFFAFQTSGLFILSDSVPLVFGTGFDTCVRRDALGVISVTDYGGSLRDFKSRGLWFGSTLTVGTLPTASAYEGMIYRVSDANAPSVGATVASGGSTKCTVQSDGSNWIVVWIA